MVHSVYLMWIDFYCYFHLQVNVFLVTHIPGTYSETSNGYPHGHGRVAHLLTKHSAPIDDSSVIVAQSSSLGSFGQAPYLLPISVDGLLMYFLLIQKVPLVRVQTLGWLVNLSTACVVIQNRSDCEKYRASVSCIHRSIMLQAATMAYLVVDAYRTAIKSIRNKHGWMVSYTSGEQTEDSAAKRCPTSKHIAGGPRKSCSGTF